MSDFESRECSTSLYEKYHAINELRKELHIRKEQLDLQIIENHVTIIKVKKELYKTCPLCLINDIDKLITEVTLWIRRVKDGEITKRKKDPGKDKHKQLCDFIELSTGIEVKEINYIYINGYARHGYTINFTEKKTGLTLELKIPNIQCRRFNVNIADYFIEHEDLKKLIGDLETIIFESIEVDGEIKNIGFSSFPSCERDMTSFGRIFYEKHGKEIKE